MRYEDYKVLAAKEYEKNRKNIFTCYFFLILSAVCFALFFLVIKELPIAGAGFLLDLADGGYAWKAFKGLHPYWEMQLALEAGKNPDEAAVFRLAAAIEYALEKKLPAFKGRALEIFKETLVKVRKNEKVPPQPIIQLEKALKNIFTSPSTSL
mgnify:CR=1 FL=1